MCTLLQSKPRAHQNENYFINAARFGTLLYFSTLLSTLTVKGTTSCLGIQTAFCTPPLRNAKPAEPVFVFKNANNWEFPCLG